MLTQGSPQAGKKYKTKKRVPIQESYSYHYKSAQFYLKKAKEPREEAVFCSSAQTPADKGGTRCQPALESLKCQGLFFLYSLSLSLDWELPVFI